MAKYKRIIKSVPQLSSVMGRKLRTVESSSSAAPAESSASWRWRSTKSTEPAPPPIEPGDVYQKVIDFEEAEAKRRSAESDAKLFYETCESLRQTFKDIDAQKSKGANADTNDIIESRDKASLFVVNLKKLNRLEKIRTKAGRDALHKEKQKLDSMHLLLQNLLYEANHLDKEVTKCLQFKSKDEEIDLVPVDEFYNNAPEEVTRPDVTKSNEHQLRLARLEWELRQRREQSEACSQLQENARKVSASLAEARARLDRLAPKLRDALNAAEPLQEALGLPNTGDLRTVQGAVTLLPPPLFLLHARTQAYAEAFGLNLVQVSIAGDEEEARRLDQTATTPLFSDSDSEQDDDTKEEDDSQEKKKRHRRSGIKVSKKERAEEKLKLVIKAHPLKVKLCIKHNETSLILSFSFLIHLKIVTVQSSIEMPKQISGISSGDVLNSQNILQTLYSDDEGMDSPHPATGYILRSAGVEENFSQFIPQLGRPYIWAQRMCGLDFMTSALPSMNEKIVTAKMPNEPCAKLSSATVENVLIVLQKHLKSRLNLMTELQELESGNLPPFEGTGSSHVRLMGSLTQWQAISWAEYSQAPSTNQFTTPGFVSHGDLFYRAIITRQSAKLIALVALKCSYPKTAPIFALTLHWNGTHHAKTDDDIRDVERCVNTDWCISRGSPKKRLTLAGQITKLIACLDILLEAVGSPEFPPDKVMFRPVKGRNRIKPYKFLKQGSGVFVQY